MWEESCWKWILIRLLVQIIYLVHFAQKYSIVITISIPWFQYQFLTNTFLYQFYQILTKITLHVMIKIFCLIFAPWDFYRLKAVSYHSKHERIYHSVISTSLCVTFFIFFSCVPWDSHSQALIDLGSKRKVLTYWLTDSDEINSLHIDLMVYLP